MDHIPTPPLPALETLNRKVELNEKENDLKKLIECINGSHLVCTKETNESQIDFDQENEKLLIESLNNLKYEQELLNNLKTSQNQLDDVCPAAISHAKSDFNLSSVLDSISRTRNSSGFPSSISSCSAASSTSISPVTVEFADEAQIKCEKTAKNNPAKSVKLTRCNVLNQILFPELKELAFAVKK